MNVVAPATVRTSRAEAQWAHEPGHFERLEAGTALGALTAPADVADTFVAPTLSLRHGIGQVLVVDGGQITVHEARA